MGNISTMSNNWFSNIFHRKSQVPALISTAATPVSLKSITGDVGANIIFNNADGTFPGATAWGNLDNPSVISTNFFAYYNEGYLANPIVYAAIESIAWAMAGIPLRVYRNTGQTADINPEIQNHPLAKLLRSPNPDWGMSEIIYQAAVSYQVCGNAYIHVIGPDIKGTGNPCIIDTVPACYMLPIPAANQRTVDYYSYAIPSETDAHMLKDTICHIRTYNPKYQYFGLPPLMAAAKSIDLNNEARTFNYHYMKNNGVPSGILSVDPEITLPTDEDLEQIHDDVKLHWQGSLNAKSPAVIPPGFKYEKIGSEPEDMCWKETLETSAAEICNVLQFPVVLLSIKDTTYNNYATARRALYQETVIPLLKRFCGQLSRHMQSRYRDPDLYIDFRVEDIEALSVDADLQAETLAKSKFLTVNEMREATGMGPIASPAGDQLIMPTGSNTLENILNGVAAPKLSPAINSTAIADSLIENI